MSQPTLTVENIGDTSTGPQWVPSSAPMTTAPETNPIDAAEQWLNGHAHPNRKNATVRFYNAQGSEVHADMVRRPGGRGWTLGEVRYPK